MTNAPQSILTGVRGWETDNEQYALKHLAAQVPADGCIVEIGSEYGMSTSILATFSPRETRVHAVDLFPGNMHRMHMDAMQAIRVHHKIVYHRGKSADVAAQWAAAGGAPIDLLFIDGDHSTEGVITDIGGWFPFVRIGGVVVFHDTATFTNPFPHEQHHWVQAAVNKIKQGNIMGVLPADWAEVVPVDSMRVFVRVGGDR